MSNTANLLSNSENNSVTSSFQNTVRESSEYEYFSERELWKEFKKGKRTAFIFIYNRYFDRLYIYGHQFTRDSELVKDCIQEIFIDIDLTKKRLSNTDSIHFYLLKTLKSKLIKVLKKNRRNLLSAYQDSFEPFNIDLSIEQKIIDRQIDEEKMQKLKNAVNNLTHREREVIFYYYYENLTLDQIKQIMGFKSVKITRNLIYKAIKELRVILS